VTDRPAWIAAPRAALAAWDAWARFAEAAHRDGLARVVVCGMGGSSLAPRVLAESLGVSGLEVLDSTDPAAVLAVERRGDLTRTLYLVVSKSGTTVETLSVARYFAARARPEQLVAVTEAGSPLERLARERRWRAVFSHPPDIGGRYSALTVVGMLPLALIGGDGPALLSRAGAVDPAPARALGARLARSARAGRDKLVLRPPRPVARLADWIEQLVAESSGKDGRGVVPVVADPAPAPRPDDEVVSEFSADPLDLGAEFLRWEYATWELCSRLRVNAFDQPDVDEAKVLARVELERAGTSAPALPRTLDPAELGRHTRPGDYFAILAYLPPDPTTGTRLAGVRAAWARALHCATTLGFGPQYLHSTGQLHKGGPASGRYLVVTADDTEDAEIPELGRTFGQLKRAQALGDVRALLGRGRLVAHVHLARPEDVEQLCPV